MKKISIIVPTYNVEQYIAKCLDSLIAQDYSNFDVIVVNDGSPFNEQAIIDTYVEKHPNIIKSIVKENGGYGSALEVGFETSDAEYVLVCDPDDYLEPFALSTLMNNIENTNADIAFGAKYLIYSDDASVEYHKTYNDAYGKIESGKLYTKDTKGFELFYFVDPSPHSKLYRRDVVKNIKFPHKCSFTDNLLFFYSLANANKVVFEEKALAYYLINRVGNTSTDVKPKVIDDHIKAFNAIMEQANTNDKAFYFRMFEAFYSIYYKIDEIGADKAGKLEKYELVYTFLEKLIPFKNEILEVMDHYQLDNETMRKQKEKLLTKETSKKMYDSLVDRRLNPSLLNNIKHKILG